MPTNGLRTLFVPVLMLFTIGYVATDISVPCFFAIRSSLITTDGLIQLSIALYFLTFGLSQLAYGPFSDRFGRRKVAICGISFSIIGTLLCLLATGIASLATGRLLQGLGLGVGAALGRAIARDVYSGDPLAQFGSLLAMGGAALMGISPLLGACIQDYLGWRMTFGFLLLYTLVSLLVIIFWLPETLAQESRLAINLQSLRKRYWTLLKSPVFLGYAGCGSLAWAGIAAFYAESPVLIEKELGLNPNDFGWLALSIPASLVLGGWINAIFVKRLGRKRCLTLGNSVLLFSSLLMLFFALADWLNLFTLLFPMSLFSLGSASTFANAFAGAFHPFGNLAGTAGALYGGLQILAGALAAGIVATMYKDLLSISLILCAVGASVFLLQLLASRSEQRSGY